MHLAPICNLQQGYELFISSSKEVSQVLLISLIIAFPQVRACFLALTLHSTVQSAVENGIHRSCILLFL